MLRRSLFAEGCVLVAACSGEGDSPPDAGDAGAAMGDATEDASGDASTTDGMATGLGDGRPEDAAGQSPDVSKGAGDGALDGAIDATLDARTGVPGAAAGSLCARTPCPAGAVQCGAQCVSSTDPRFGCGADSCAPCAIAHAKPRCASQACAIAACEAGWADCNGDPSDGCEADLTSPASCGACGVACAAPNGVCTPSGCASTCSPPLTLCSSDSGTANDRCVDLTKAPYECGGCGTACSASSTPY